MLFLHGFDLRYNLKNKNILFWSSIQSKENEKYIALNPNYNLEKKKKKKKSIRNWFTNYNPYLIMKWDFKIVYSSSKIVKMRMRHQTSLNNSR